MLGLSNWFRSTLSKLITNLTLPIFTSLLLSIASLGVSQAHPHAWTDLQVKIVNQAPSTLKLKSRDYGDEVVFPQLKLAENQTPIYGFIFTLTLDELASAPLLVDLKHGMEEQIWQEVASNLVDAHFFTKMRLLNKRLSPLKDNIRFANAIAMLKVQANKKQPDKLDIQYFAPLEQPLILSPEQILEVMTYDEPYWMDMKYHHQKTDISFTNPHSPNQCNYVLEAASPSQSLIDYASSLPADAVPNDPDIGRFFSQTIYIGCPFAK